MQLLHLAHLQVDEILASGDKQLINFCPTSTCVLHCILSAFRVSAHLYNFVVTE